MSRTATRLQLGTGEVAKLISEKHWDDSPLGPPDGWPQSLQTVVSLMLNSKFPMFVAWGTELGFIYNDAYSEVLGQKHPQALGLRFADIWSEIWPEISPIIDKAMAGESSYFENLPLTMLRKGFEEQTWFTFSYSPVYDENQSVAGMYCTCTETTQQVLAERRRQDENERLKDFFQQAPGIMAVLRDADHTFELANHAYFQLVGERELVGKPVREALPELEGQGWFELLDHVYTSGESYQGRAMPVELRRKHGQALDQRYVDFVYQPIRDNRGKVTGIFLEGSDVTEAVHATKALQENEQRLRQLANTIPQMAWMARPDGYVHWFNDRFFDYTGTAQEQVLDWGWASIHHPDNRSSIISRYRALIARGEPFEMTCPLRAATGDYRTFFITVAPLYDAAGNIEQWFGTNTDIHEIEQAQKELRAANRRKDEFLAMLAHELRNPLAPISTASDLLKRPGLSQKQARAASEVIARQVVHMTELVDDLLDVSRVTRGLVTLEQAPVGINEVVLDALEQVTHIVNSKRQKLTTEIATKPIQVMGDRTRLVQIFSNILNNAARYTPVEGEIFILVDATDTHVQVRITDTGMGIEPKLLPHIFELFTQAERSPDRAQGGLGLGLSLVKSLVDLHRGKVTARSNGPERGSEFTVTLPLYTGAATAPSPVDSSAELGETVEAEQRILVVDDNVDAADTLSLLLESHGYPVQAQYTAADAIEFVHQHSPPVIVLDIGLPDMDGYELAKHLRATPQAASAVLIALTGYGQNRDRERSKEAGFSHHLVKPVVMNELLSVIASAKVH